MTEQQAIELLSSYRAKQARIKTLDAHSVGGGITISRLCEDDQLQQLHQRLRGLPSYMYLSRQELQLEATAHAYLDRYPAGTRAQLAAVPSAGADTEDTAQLQELRGKIKRVIEARGVGTHDLDTLLERLAEAQDLQTELRQIDAALEALASYKPEYARLLRLRYVEDSSIERVAEKLQVSRRTYERLRPRAIAEFVRLSG
ncbi:ECF-type sigma factor [Paenibacillus pasadenensis]|uniref:ECF-type sigma factor n=1 Tax=Paenibacillus pasadenensis TaxID=217090 RepID=UPI00204237C4|nr:ECF-type sigma factor [Paenibacillus pasadenensis]MCM3747439.1 ECF-type sigma factor [Paenibacillus pasadenensis]